MLVVLAVIATMAALAWPAMRKPLGKWKLAEAAKQLRAELGRVRLEAIETGQTFHFRYLPGSGIYRVEPADAGPVAANRLQGGTSFEANSDTGLFDSEPPSYDNPAGDHGGPGLSTSGTGRAQRHTLPSDTVFAAPHDDANEQGSLDIELHESEMVSDLDWSAPIVFYPNGRTSDARIQLVGQHDYRIQLTLRGLTGAVQVGDLQPPVDQLDDRSALDYEP